MTPFNFVYWDPFKRSLYYYFCENRPDDVDNRTKRLHAKGTLKFGYVQELISYKSCLMIFSTMILKDLKSRLRQQLS